MGYTNIIEDYILLIFPFLLLLSDNEHLRSSDSAQCGTRSPWAPVMSEPRACPKLAATGSKSRELMEETVFHLLVRDPTELSSNINRQE
jgi:hypothetical protein